jgi:cytochrome c biogenesis protein CcmG, thiol:disulfide interchange protein DsbE
MPTDTGLPEPDTPRWLYLLSLPPWLVLLASVVVAGVVWILSSRPAPTAQGAQVETRAQAGYMAPDVALPASDGSAVVLSNLRNNVVVLNFWASWCPPCRAEMPALNRIADKYRSLGVTVLGVNATDQDDEAAARSFARAQGLTFPILLDNTGVAGNAYRLRSLPTTYFIGKNGVISDIVIGGPMSDAAIESRIKRLLAGGR